jgi:hypothetical protein
MRVTRTSKILLPYHNTTGRHNPEGGVSMDFCNIVITAQKNSTRKVAAMKATVLAISIPASYPGPILHLYVEYYD